MSSLDITRVEREPDPDKRAWDAQRPPELDLIRDCVHCGFCLPTCPSYAVFEDEMDSPRGRILLMRIGHAVTQAMQPRQRSKCVTISGEISAPPSCPMRMSRIRPRGESISSSKTA